MFVIHNLYVFYFQVLCTCIGVLMFAVGVNSRENDFLEAFKRPAALFAGYVGQFVMKPLLGYFFGIISVTLFGLPTSIGQEISLSPVFDW